MRTIHALQVPLLLSTALPAGALEEPPVRPDGRTALQAGLAWLVEHQCEDGSWRGAKGHKVAERYAGDGEMAAHLGVTGLAGLALLARASADGAEVEAVRRAAAFVLSSVSEFGSLRDERAAVYDHSLVTLFLAEAKGRVEVPGLDSKLTLLVDMLVRSQAKDGGWTYALFAPGADISVTACVLEALAVARKKGLDVPETTFRRARELLEALYASGGASKGPGDDAYYCSGTGSFRYSLGAEKRGSVGLTVAGIAAARAYGGEARAFERSRGLLKNASEAVERRFPHFLHWH